MFQQLSETSNGKTLLGFLDRLIREAVDIRNITGNADAEKKGREVAVKLLEENLVNRLKELNGTLEAPDEDDYL